MPSHIQRVQIGINRYAGSKMQTRNRALKLAKKLGALQISDVRVEKLIGLNCDCVTTVTEYCEDNNIKVLQQINQNREAFLLIVDELNPDEFWTMAIDDCRVEAVELRTGLCWIYLAKGEALISPMTLVYWK